MKDYDNNHAAHYAKFRNNYRSTGRLVWSQLEKIGIKNKIILDFGCGQGIDTLAFMEKGAKKVIGIDPSQAMIDIAKQSRIKGSEFIRTNGKTLPFKANQFDLVFADFVVHYLKDTKKQFAQIYRVMKPGASFIAVFNCLTNDDRLVNKIVPMTLGKGEGQSIVHVYSKSRHQIKEHLQQAGFVIELFDRIANPDAHLAPGYDNKFKFRKYPLLFVATKLK